MTNLKRVSQHGNEVKDMMLKENRWHNRSKVIFLQYKKRVSRKTKEKDGNGDRQRVREIQ